MFNWLKKLGRSPAQRQASSRFEPVDYQGYRIQPDPQAEGGQYRLRGRILAERDGETREYLLIRADLLPSAEQAAELMIGKARRLIDESGDRLFD
jgi:hypothetical protein